MKKMSPAIIKRFRAEIALVMVAIILITSALGLQMFVFAKASKTVNLEVEGGQTDFTFSSEKRNPQLEITLSNDSPLFAQINTLQMDIKLEGVETVINYLRDTSNSSVGTGEFISGDPNKALAIYFGGEEVTGTGVTITDFKAALVNNKADLAAGKTVTLNLPISGSFSADSSITKLLMMVSYNNTKVKGIAVSLQNLKLIGEAEDDTPSDTAFGLANGPEYRFEGNEWAPQLTIAAVTPIKSQNEFDKITFNLKLKDISAIKNCFSAGSCSALDGQSFTYDASLDLGIYFTGTNVSSVGIRQDRLFEILLKNEESLAKGETVTVTLPISGAFTDDGEITGISVMLAHGGDAGTLNGVPISISDFEFIIAADESGETSEKSDFVLEGGPEYRFNGNEWYPQLTINTKGPFVTSHLYGSIKFDLKLKDISTIKNSFSAGSRSSLDDESFTYDASKDLGIYFTGTNVSSVGVRQDDLFDALLGAEELLSKGETVTVTLPISGAFTDDGEITGISIMLAHDRAAGTLNGVPISISGITFLKEGEGEHAENELVLKDGPAYILNGEPWYPQLDILTESFNLPKTTGFMQMEISVSDIDAVIDNFSAGSRSSLGGGSFTYDASQDLGIYFTGTNILGIGVAQDDLRDALNAARNDFLKGKHVVLELPVKGELGEDAVINRVHFMLAHDNPAANLAGVEFNILHITFSESKTVEEPVAETLNSSNMLSNSKKVVVAFANKKIYVVEKTTVGDLLNAVILPDGFKKNVNYENSLMSNRTKEIDDYDYVFVVTDTDGNQMKFPVIPCKAKANGSVDTSKPIADNKNVSAIEEEEEKEPIIEEVDYRDPGFSDMTPNDSFFYEEDDGITEEVIQQIGGTKKNVKKYSTVENMPLYPTVQLIIMMALSMVAGAAIMFVIDLFRMKKIILFKKKNS